MRTLLITAALLLATPAYAQDTWTVGCQPDQADPYGKVVEKAKCFAMVSYLEPGDTAPIGVATIFEIDARGARITTNPDLDPKLCPAKPQRMAVDGKRIDGLAMPQRIDAALSGARLTREKDRGWPYCNLMNETTTLSGARAAYEAMQAAWAAR